MDEESGNLMFDLHLAQDGGTIVRDGDVSVGGDEDLIQTTGAQRGADDLSDRLCSLDMSLEGREGRGRQGG